MGEAAAEYGDLFALDAGILDVVEEGGKVFLNLDLVFPISLTTENDEFVVPAQPGQFGPGAVLGLGVDPLLGEDLGIQSATSAVFPVVDPKAIRAFVIVWFFGQYSD